MDMDKIAPKLDTFAAMVLKDASQKAGLLLNQAMEENRKLMEEQDLVFLKEAYHSIQEAINKIEKDNNEIYSAKFFEAKQLLFKKRQEIMDDVFQRVRKRLEQYRAGNEYIGKLEAFLKKGIAEVGQGEIQVLSDGEDLEHINKLKKRLNHSIDVIKSDEPLLGGCIVVNRTTGLMADFSFSARLKQQREIFLELSGMNIDL